MSVTAAALASSRPGVPDGLEVMGELGRGASSVVYRVRRDGRELALKTVSAAARASLRREAALMGWIDHPGLPRAYAVGDADGGPYLLMELIEGSDLERLLVAGPLPVEQAIEAGRQVAAVLAAAHRAGAVHRDVKPANIVMTPDGRARLLDLGLAAKSGFVADATVGTLTYAAPEQAGVLNRPVDARSDLYALGAVLFECLTGVPPYRATDAGDLLRLHASAPVPDPRALRPGVPDRLAEILIRLLAKDPDDRYAGAAEVVADLDRLAGGPATDLGSGRGALVGRREQLDALVAAWDRAAGGAGGVASVSGAVGCGKTRLLEELVDRVRGAERPALVARCLPGGAPLGALRGALDGYARSVLRLPAQQQATVRKRLRGIAGADAALLGRLSPALAGLLGVTAAEQADHQAFLATVAEFLAGFAEAQHGALLALDDAENLDEASRAVLRLAGLRLSGTPLLIVLAGAEDRLGHGVPVDDAVRVEPLDDPAKAALLRALSPAGAGELLAERLAGWGTGTPLEISEYLAAIVDAGLLVPDWGSWKLDLEGLGRLALPGDVLGLLARRLDALPAAGRDLLNTAAVLGMRFAPETLARAAAVARDAADRMIAEAYRAGVVEPRDGGVAFTHESLRDALLGDMTEAQRRDRHQRIADAMWAIGGDRMPADPAARYALADHVARGEPDRDPERAVRIMLSAAHRAMADAAPALAVTLIESARRFTGKVAVPGTSPFEMCEALGAAQHAAGRLVDAVTTYQEALGLASGPLERAGVLAALAEVHMSKSDLAATTAAVADGLAELGRTVSGNPLKLVLGSVTSAAAGAAVAVTRAGFGTARGDRRRHNELLARLYRVLHVDGIAMLKPEWIAVATLRMLYPSARLGISRDYAESLGHANVLLALAGMRRYRGLIRRADRVAERLGDRRLRSHLTWTSLIIPALLGRADSYPALLRLAEQDRHLPPVDYYVSMWINASDLVNRGYAQAARELHEATRTRLVAHDFADQQVVTLVGASVDALRGRLVDAEIALGRLAAQTAATGSARLNELAVALQLAVEQRDLGAGLDRLAGEVEAMGLRPAQLVANQRPLYLALAFARIEQCRTAGPPDRQARLGAARHAVTRLGEAATVPSLRAHHTVASAYLHDLAGEHERALEALDATERDRRAADAPLADYEAFRLRARALAALGRHEPAVVAAASAASLAGVHGWPHRVAWLRAEFPALTHTASTTNVPRSTRATGSEPSYHPYQRRIAALEQISLAATQVLDPAELTRIALDQAIRLFGADRAYLFLVDAADGAARLGLHQGRDNTGADVEQLTGYSASLVETVRVTGTPVVVTGTEEGEALGSHSAVMYDLRSIMVVPMQLDGRLLGVLYVDSRLAKGMFTVDDATTLAAIAGHVAAALETARAAQLAMAVQIAERQRDTAETIRRALAELTTTLDPAEVLQRLAAILGAHLAADDVQLLLAGGDGPDIGPLLRGTAPTAGGPQDRPAPARPGTRSWLSVPLHARDRAVGAILLTSDTPDRYGAAEVDLAATLAGQGTVAYDNACLFAQVERLATTDELTGLANRRHFFGSARQVTAAHRPGQNRLAAAMVDIDHFKAINDTHGHHVGDQVIRAVAGRLAGALRDIDLIGRYGGEEFAMILPDIAGEALPAVERVRQVVSGTPIPTDAGPLHVTVSAGVAYRTARSGDLDKLLATADEALYQAKQGGRDRTVQHPDDEVEAPAD